MSIGFIRDWEMEQGPMPPFYEDKGGWTPVEAHTFEECTNYHTVEVESTYAIVIPYQATGNERQDAHWMAKHAPGDTVTLVGDAASGEIGEVRYPLEYQLHRRQVLVNSGQKTIKELLYVDDLPQPYKRLDWGDAIQFYLVASGWSSKAMNGISVLRQENWGTQNEFIQALIDHGMDELEAEFLNAQIQIESARRRKDPLRWGLVPC